MFKKLKRELCSLLNFHSWEKFDGTQNGYYRICRSTGKFQRYIDGWFTIYQKPVLKPVMYYGSVIDYQIVEDKIK